MISQQLSGINIYAFLATQFYSTAGPAKTSDQGDQEHNEANSFKFAIGFGAANMIFSSLAYFLVENPDPKPTTEATPTNTFDVLQNPVERPSVAVSDDRIAPDQIPRDREDSGNAGATSSSDAEQASIKSGSSVSAVSSIHDEDVLDYGDTHRFHGRRFLLLTSLAAGVVTLLLTSTMFNLDESNPARLPMIIFFIIVFTAFYSPVGHLPMLDLSQS